MMVISEVIWQKMSIRWLVALNLGNIRSRTSNFPEARYNSGLQKEIGEIMKSSNNIDTQITSSKAVAHPANLGKLM